jgi:hypothetical protein
MTLSAVFAFLFSPLGRWLVGGLAIVAVVGGIYLKGVSDGKAIVQAKWDAAVQAAIERGNKARSDAEHSTDREPDPQRLRDDKFNRD